MNTTFDSSSPPRLMLIDDDLDVHQSVEILMRRAGIVFVGVASPEEAYSTLEFEAIDVVLLDLNFERGQTQGEEGFAALARILGDDPDTAVVVITGHSGVRIAVAAMRAGAFDFVMKPWRNDELLERVRAAVAHRQRRREIAALQGEATNERNQPLQILGASAGMEQVRQMVRRVAPTTVDVLIIGPAGSGRSLAARVIHAGSPLAARDFVPIEAEAAADPADMAAAADLERAHEGTLLLCHVDRLDGAAQTRLLARLGRDMRVIATAESAGSLSPALRARVGTIEIRVPALVERCEDAVLLARHFLRRAERQHARPAGGFTPEAEQLIAGTAWPDEVRGLAQAVERAVVLGEGHIIGPAELGLVRVSENAPTPIAPPPVVLSLEESEKALVAAALKRNGFNVSRAADDLGLSRAALYRRMAKHGL